MQHIRLAALAAAISLTATSVFAEGVLSSKSRAALFANQTSVLDRRAAVQYSGIAAIPSDPLSSLNARLPVYGARDPGPYLGMAREAARRHGIPETLFVRLVRQESGWNARARSPKGALGLAQLMPFTAQTLGVDPMIPAQNLDGGARYLKAQYQTFGSWRLALAAYNAGPEAVRKYNGVPPYKETRNYVVAILGDG